QSGIGGGAGTLHLLVVLVGEVDRAALELFAWLLDLHVERHPFAGLQPEQEVVGVGDLGLGAGEEEAWRLTPLDEHLGGGGGETLAGTDEERHARPPPRV